MMRGEMLGRKERDQLELFISGSLRQLVPDDHVLVRVDRILDLSWLRDEVADCYCLEDGRPGIDPKVAVRLMLAGLLTGIVHDRRLMREAQVNLAIRWFAGYALHEKLPDDSSLTRLRQRWKSERFKAVLSRTVKACVAVRIATGEVVHLDATLIRANVSWDAIVEAHADAVLTELDNTSAPSPEVTTTSKTRADLPNGSGRLARKGWSSASGRAGLQTANCGRRQARRDSRRRSDHGG
jgi:transposase